MPDVLMLDEPTSALDTQNANTILTNIIKFCKDHSITLIIVSHDKDLIDKYAENIIYLKKK
jgi:ABC-type glutathione transport system ATPase component